MPANRPLTCPAHEVVAILDGRQRQVRRVLERVPLFSAEYDRQWLPHVCPPGGALPEHWSWWEGPPHGPSLYHREKLPYAAGDHLDIGGRPFVVTAVKVERLQSLKGIDMIAEGLRCEGCYDTGHSACRDGGCFAQRIDYSARWDILHDKGSWERNPWTVAISTDPLPAVEAAPEGVSGETGEAGR